MVIRDELWRSLRIPAMIRKIDSDLRLSRAQGTIQVLATHRLADFETAAAAGHRRGGHRPGLIASCDTRICLAQDTAPLAVDPRADRADRHRVRAHRLLVRRAARPRLWKIGRASSHIVQLVLTPAERRLFWTNQRMNIGSGQPAIPGTPSAAAEPGGTS